MTTNDPRTEWATKAPGQYFYSRSSYEKLSLTIHCHSHWPLCRCLGQLYSFINHFQLGCIFILLFYYWTDQGTLDVPAEVGIDISLKATEQRSVYSVQLYTLRLYSSSTFEFNWYANKMTGTATDTRKGKLRCGWCVLVNCWWSFVFNDH